jgi:large subunit ribosomal protein L21
MKKAVRTTGGKQYLVAKGDEIDIELLDAEKKTVTFEPLLVFDEKDTKVGTPTVNGAKVTATILSTDKRDDKVVSIRYKAKKRVRKVHGHRQRKATIKIDSIS